MNIHFGSLFNAFLNVLFEHNIAKTNSWKKNLNYFNDLTFFFSIVNLFDTRYIFSYNNNFVCNAIKL